MIATLLIATLAATVQAAVWRATRNARIAFAGERALLGADAAISTHLASWDGRAFASMPIGAQTTSTPSLTANLAATVTVVRTGLNNAMVEASATSTNNGVPRAVERHVSRMLTVRNPPLPLNAPLTMLGSATFAYAGTVSTTDETPPGWASECLGTDSVDAPTTSASVSALRSQFDAGWSKWLSVAHRTDDPATVSSLVPIVTAVTCAPATGDPHRGAGSIAACTNEWGARALNATFTVTTTSRHQGILMVDGDLTLNADLDVFGLLMVRGAIDATAGRLLVHGAALVRDEMGHGSRFGFASRVRYSRCALRRAYSATGAPAAVTTRGWLERF
ncbi:MAG: hypothetical protein H7Z40_14885 [Phycisphaerae bacterium]|nr:hypothetical protein [Gemmatimonadaceae bacterium]